MENTEPPTEDFAQLLARLKDEYSVSESEIARRINVSAATVNNWVHRKRGSQRGPHRENLQALAQAFPKFTEKMIFDAVGRAVPGPLAPDRKERILAYFEQLTEEQMEWQEIQIKAVAESNHRAHS